MVFCTIIAIAEMGCDMINDLKEQKQDDPKEEIQIAGSGSPVERQLYVCTSLWSNLEFGSRSATALQMLPNRETTALQMTLNMPKNKIFTGGFETRPYENNKHSFKQTFYKHF